ncbi:hypothetical protein [Caldalkalibacillus thermarum]|uniref:hypothetical protein n=1 Tax=Caldalkalibacillus thermarum TaxID=296745 RepID=UPI0002D309A0|nr:hypothetical protein [Caldalkalibacillus thermarum]
MAAFETGLETVEAIVTFRGFNPPGEHEIQLLKDVGISAGFTFQSLPMAAQPYSKCPRINQLECIQPIVAHYLC